MGSGRGGGGGCGGGGEGLGGVQSGLQTGRVSAGLTEATQGEPSRD